MGKIPTGKTYKIDDDVAAAAAAEDDRKEVINTTETLKEGSVDVPEIARTTLEGSAEDAIYTEYNQAGASVAEIADKYGVKPSEVFAIVDRKNGVK